MLADTSDCVNHLTAPFSSMIIEDSIFYGTTFNYYSYGMDFKGYGLMILRNTKFVGIAPNTLFRMHIEPDYYCVGYEANTLIIEGLSVEVAPTIKDGSLPFLWEFDVGVSYGDESKECGGLIFRNNTISNTIVGST